MKSGRINFSTEKLRVWDERSARILPWLGAAWCAFFCVFGLILGGNISIKYFDQFDGEMSAYFLRARHLTASAYEEIMSGLPVSGLTPGAPWLTLFFLFLKLPAAYTCANCFLMLSAFLGMYFLLCHFEVRPWIAFLAGITFASVPFFTVYGLSIMGIPLLLYVALFRDDAKQKRAMVSAVLSAAIYAEFSSLVWCGYADLIVLAACWLILFLGRHRKIGAGRELLRRRIFAAGLSMFAVYFCNNFSLVLQVLGIGSFTSHREEWVLNSYETSALPGVIWSVFREGLMHAESKHIEILHMTAVSLALFFLVFVVRLIAGRKGGERGREDAVLRREALAVLALLSFAFLIAVFYAAFLSEPVVALRRQLPASLRTFQFNRFYWFYPPLWYGIAGLSADLLVRLLPGKVRILGALFVLAVFGMTWKECAKSNVVYIDALQYVLPGFGGGQFPTYDAFFAEDLYAQIRDDIGKPQEEYRIVSLGLFPTAPLYSGFYCLDGYSNNYPLEYKHIFSEINKGEFLQNDEMRGYFENWGSRCYLYSHEFPELCWISKHSELAVNDLCIDLDGLRGMGCGYLFSAVPINAPEQYGLRLFGAYDTESSYYRVYVYEL